VENKLVIYRRSPAKRALKAFVVGSSLPAVAVTMTYTGVANYRSKTPVHFEPLVAVVPGVLGAMNTASVMTQDKFGTGPLKTQLAFGAATGLLMSLIGRFGFDLPDRIFGGDTPMVHVEAPLLYAAIFGAIFYPLNKIVLGETLEDT